MYAEFATDPVVQCLAFDDQRHFLMLLCFKCSGLLDREFATRQQRFDVIRKSLGLDGKAWDEMRTRLVAVKLIDDELQPVNWNKRQFISDNDPTAAERQRRRRSRMRHGPVTRESRPSDTDSDTDKNPERAREPAQAKGAARAPSAPPQRTTKAEASTSLRRIGELLPGRSGG